MSMGRRVDALEAVRRRDRRKRNIPMIGAELGETADEAIARYVAEHGPLEDVEEDEVNAIVVTWPYSPQEGPAA